MLAEGFCLLPLLCPVSKWAELLEQEQLMHQDGGKLSTSFFDNKVIKCLTIGFLNWLGSKMLCFGPGLVFFFFLPSSFCSASAEITLHYCSVEVVEEP